MSTQRAPGSRHALVVQQNRETGPRVWRRLVLKKVGLVEHVRPTIKSKVFLIIQPEAKGSSLLHQLKVGNGTLFFGGGGYSPWCDQAKLLVSICLSR